MVVAAVCEVHDTLRLPVMVYEIFHVKRGEGE